LVALHDELAFAESYVGVLRVRFGDAVRLRSEGLEAAGSWLIPAISLQVLLENAVKHNALDEKAPLEIDLALVADRLHVSNPVRRRTASAPSAGVGLANLEERYRHLVGEPPEIREERTRFTVVLPLVGPRPRCSSPSSPPPRSSPTSRTSRCWWPAASARVFAGGSSRPICSPRPGGRTWSWRRA